MDRFHPALWPGRRRSIVLLVACVGAMLFFVVTAETTQDRYQALFVVLLGLFGLNRHLAIRRRNP